MAKTYVPGTIHDVHRLAIFLAKHNSQIQIAILALDSAALAPYVTMYNAILAFDAFRETLYPLGD